jgi:glycosyltransferase involved in cell wall biosynthesis
VPIVTRKNRILWRTYEIIFVDNASTDDTRSILYEFFSRHLHAKSVYEKNTGMGNVRKAGWPAATASIIAFTDDDCYPDKNFLNAIMLCFKIRRLAMLVDAYCCMTRLIFRLQ